MAVLVVEEAGAGLKMREFFNRLSYLFKPSNSWDVGYNEGYKRGLREGQDFGERVAHNRTLAQRAAQNIKQV
jgi:hypothetical protein